ncbi:NosD-like parallel beta-helix repeat membrane-crossing protein [Candidatus Mancarchaeum acidiphilum]|uniref:NosD-like parallel beta-helix repeat membrane-crossing protein n=1 Tax=Candidatus Mancarchaeum acidiphilum TaxID=1920749 RepID=A0A218NM79_9ARCH|nr:right-handed parallel beta-helix repeat-containing protein [Candidatus Mancarchaeum acidiphilum]ASI13580.1 NosD-like parallel beta-helix repeat membrane-crossing protein [Candidatus Mancarchaeum acidiphilum]
MESDTSEDNIEDEDNTQSGNDYISKLQQNSQEAEQNNSPDQSDEPSSSNDSSSDNDKADDSSPQPTTDNDGNEAITEPPKKKKPKNISNLNIGFKGSNQEAQEGEEANQGNRKPIPEIPNLDAPSKPPENNNEDNSGIKWDTSGYNPHAYVSGSNANNRSSNTNYNQPISSEGKSIANNQPKRKFGFPNNKKLATVKPKVLLTTEQAQKRNKKFLLVMVIILIAIIAVVLASTYLHHKKVIVPPPPPTPKFHYINSCQDVINPGVYYLGVNLTYSGSSGTCITIDTNNVAFICKDKGISGKGPYIVTSTSTNGVVINKKSNVSISGCSIKDFSYGVSIQNSSGVSITFDNISHNTISNVRISGGENNSVINNTLSGAGLDYGSLYLTGNTTDNLVEFNKITSSANYSIYVNSSGNKFYENYINNTPYGFYCNVDYGLIRSNLAKSNICNTNFGCDFVKCSLLNIPDNVSKITLTPSITSCGSITSPGDYYLKNNISAGYAYSNTSSSLVKNISLYYPKCITIKSPNVNLDCNNFTIYNSSEGIYYLGLSNVSIENCNFRNVNKSINVSISNDSKISNIRINDSSIYGVGVVSSTKVDFSNLSISNSTKGINIFADSEYNSFNKIAVSNNFYGIYLNISNLNDFSNFTINKNTFGVFINDSLYNQFNKGTILNSTKIDLYAQPGSIANKTTNLFYSTVCGLSDTKWGVCTYYVLPNLKFYPVDSCLNVTRSGTYALDKNLVTSSSDCIDIKVPDVNLSCGGYSISQLTPGYGSAIYDKGEKNVTISGCAVYTFNKAFDFEETSNINIYNSTASDQTPIYFSDVNHSYIINNTFDISGNTGLILRNVSKSVIYTNKITGNSKGSGLVLNNSYLNLIFNNSIYSNKIGFALYNNSVKNTIFNNTVQISSNYDYYCSPNASPIYSEYKGFNYGQKENDCYWLSALSPTSPSAECYIVSNPTTINLGADYLYKYGTVCMKIRSNDVTFNCDNHTVSALNGGTFINVSNSKNFKLENCYMQGFTAPIQVYNSSGELTNNQILVKSAYKSDAIEISNSPNMSSQNNLVYNYS